MSDITRADTTYIKSKIAKEIAAFSLLIGFIGILAALASFSPKDLYLSIHAGLKSRNLLGIVGAHVADLLYFLFGVVAFELIGWGIYLTIKIAFNRPPLLKKGDWLAFVLHILGLCAFSFIAFHSSRFSWSFSPGGIVGYYPGKALLYLFSTVGSIAITVSVVILSLLYLFRISLIDVGYKLTQTIKNNVRPSLKHKKVEDNSEDVIPTVIQTEQSFQTTMENSIEVVDVVDSVDIQTDVENRVKNYGQPKEDSRPVLLQETTKHLMKQDVIDVGRNAVKSTAMSNVRTSNGPVIVNDYPDSRAGQGGVQQQSSTYSGTSKTSVGTSVRTNSGSEPVIKQRFIQDDVPAAGTLRSGASDWELPPLALLEYQKQAFADISEEKLKDNARTLERKLKNYKVEGRVTEIHPGPVVTMYEFLPAPGVKISQVANLSDDLAMALHALSVRIVAPLPGKGVIGIEVPNDHREIVYLREILGSDAFKNSKGKLTLALGKDIVGKPVVADLAKLPHLLIAGATGSGKSVALNSFILSILYNSTPEDVRIILVDPKVVELQIYEGIPHLLLPVVYDAKHASLALKWAVGEMERRYELLAKYSVRNIDSFNKLVKKHMEQQSNGFDMGGGFGGSIPMDAEDMRPLPRLIVVVDEFADLMMVASKDVEQSVARLAQKARAAGIHLIMATQRPSKDVVTGLIKANFPARISFRVSSKVDSRIILDQNGAETLLGYGDMLFMRPGSSVLQRVHGCYVSEEDVKRVVDAWSSQGEPNYEMDILVDEDNSKDIDPKDLDPLIEDAKQIVLESGKASISYLQRRLKVGYNRAARMMEQLEKLGVVGPPDHRGERKILIE